jgi:hypothetical protein
LTLHKTMSSDLLLPRPEVACSSCVLHWGANFLVPQTFLCVFWFPSSGERRLGCMVMSGSGYLKFGCCWVVFGESSCAIGNCLMWFSLSQQRSLYCTIDVSIKSKTSEGSYLLSFSSWMSSS